MSNIRPRFGVLGIVWSIWLALFYIAMPAAESSRMPFVVSYRQKWLLAPIVLFLVMVPWLPRTTRADQRIVLIVSTITAMLLGFAIWAGY
jgi:hypothetical protein